MQGLGQDARRMHDSSYACTHPASSTQDTGKRSNQNKRRRPGPAQGPFAAVFDQVDRCQAVCDCVEVHCFDRSRSREDNSQLSLRGLPCACLGLSNTVSYPGSELSLLGHGTDKRSEGQKVGGWGVLA